MNSRAPQAGWYPDPSGDGGQRYFDGTDWTTHFSPPPAPQPTIIINNTNTNTVGAGPMIVSRRPNHGLHLVLTVLTCGLWLPVWLLVAIAGGGNHVQVGNALSGAAKSAGQVSGRGWAIAGAAFGGLILLGIVAEHPMLLIPAAVIAVAGSFGYREYLRAAQRRADHAGLAARADAENRAVNSGDPVGFYGQYPPPSLPPIPPPPSRP